MNSLHGMHSDTEIGRCVLKHTGTSCVGFKNHFHQVYNVVGQDGYIKSRILNEKTKQSVLAFTETPYQVHWNAAFLHSFKKAADLLRFHQQMTHGLRPTLPMLALTANALNSIPGSKSYVKETVRLINHYLRHSCTNNPMLQRERPRYSDAVAAEIAGKHVPLPATRECRDVVSPSSLKAIATPTVFGNSYNKTVPQLLASAGSAANTGNRVGRGQVYSFPPVLVIAPLPKSSDSVARINRLLRQLQTLGVDDKVVEWVDFEAGSLPAAAAGTHDEERDREGYEYHHYNQNMVGPLERLRNRLGTQHTPGVSAGIVLHGFDALACDFAGMLHMYFASPRCGRHLITNGGGGVLYLGAGTSLHRTEGARQRIADDVSENTDHQGLGNAAYRQRLDRRLKTQMLSSLNHRPQERKEPNSKLRSAESAIQRNAKHFTGQQGPIKHGAGNANGNAKDAAIRSTSGGSENRTGVYDGDWDHMCYNIWSPAETCPVEDLVSGGGGDNNGNTFMPVGEETSCRSGHSCFSAVYHSVALAELITLLRGKYSAARNGKVHACTLAAELGHKGHITRAATAVLTVPFTVDGRAVEARMRNTSSAWCAGG